LYVSVAKTLLIIPNFLHHYLESVQMRSIKFTKIDRKEPDKPFSFALILDRDTDLYELSECNPPLNQKQIDDVVSKLNADKDGLNGFVVSMRRLFKETLQ